MFPIRDHNPSRTTPYVVYSLLALNVIVFLWQTMSPEFPSRWALIPARFAPETYITHQFLHGGLLHLAGNMLFLWIFGDNLEDRMGRLPFLGFYLASGVAAGLAQAAWEPSSTIPMVGASGAIAGVMGGYLLLFPKAKVDVLLILLIFFRIFAIPAWIVLGVWFALQVGSGAMTPVDQGGVAYWAHAGGFVAGVVLAMPVFARLGGRAFWQRTQGHPQNAPVVYRRSPIPAAGRRQ